MHMKKLTTLACAAAFAMLSGAASAQISGNTVKIGVLTDMSGTYSDITGMGAVEAVKMAVEEFGGEINGLDIEAMVDCLLGADPLSCKCADMNMDGVVGLDDVSAFATVVLAGGVCEGG